MVICCAVSGCKRESYPGCGISFHRIPANRRESWLTAMKLDTKVSKFACVCGAHFRDEDYITGLKSKLKPQAVPSILNPKAQLNPFQYITPYIERNCNENNNNDNKLSESEQNDESDSEQNDDSDCDKNDCSASVQNKSQDKITFEGVCRTCLCNDRTLYDIPPQNQLTFQDVLIKNDPDGKAELPLRVCWECHAKMTSFTTFKAKAMQANDLLISLIQTLVTSSADVSSIDRVTHNLTSTLTNKIFEADHVDYHFEYSSDDETPKNDTQLEIQTTDLDTNEQDTIPFTNIEEDDPNILSYTQNNVIKKISKRRERKRVLKKGFIENFGPANELNNEIFDVQYLTPEEQMEEINNRQYSANYKNSGFKCNECFKGFVYEDAFNLHMMKHTNQNGPYCCGVCKIRYMKKQDLRRHILQHMQKFSCKKCNYVTSIRHSAKLHEKYHSGTKYVCPHCLENFVKKTTYLNHVRIKHPSDIVCRLCGYSFVSDKGLLYHMKRKHRFDDHQIPIDGPWCIKCDIQFFSLEALEKHVILSSKHSKDEVTPSKPVARRYYSWQESSSSTHGARVKKSRMARQPSGPITCEQCEMQLPDARAYFVHFRREHPDKNRTKYAMKSQIMCEVCGRMFQSAAALRYHSFSHEESKQFHCSFCDKQFMRKTGLATHERLMHGETKPCYSCNICSKNFTSLSNMLRHKAIHTGLKPYQCEICGKFFKDAREKRAHITYVHLKKPWPKRVRVKRKENKQNLPQSTQVAISKGQPVKIYIIRRK